MKIAAVQFNSTGDIKENLATITKLVTKAAGEGAKLIVLPEATSQNFDSGRLDTQAQELDGPFATGLREVAEKLDVVVVAGMFRPADSVGDVNRVYNTALITGAGVHKGYNKIHTYDVEDYQESETVKPGDSLCTFEVEGVTVGVAICYDVRYPEQFRDLARAGAQVIAVPVSWADGPGKLEQWRLLSTARGLDSTAYIVAADQSRPGGNAKAGETSGPLGVGHSVVVSPTGERLAEAGYEDTIIYADIDPEVVDKVRAKLPVLK
ncbi:amidohydrolase [Corynebacterium phocae]|uniref:Amidohydrolase n=1 Tax=Corynebacterium phocae TaxID=161895 RepID=A0A1L7D5F3_9CORY|nr:carbon-nitrogen hydrolase family protein [Corynebacterium phocae]APT93340.1 amidohydrolase [Corynebacterium phocae]KAA8721673.1 carbon-nitrogen hydrolase family protein [Corynebacterium phocae]